MHTLALHGIVVEQFVFLIDTLLLGEALVGLELRELRGDVGQHKEVAVVHLCCQPVSTFIGEFAGVQLFLHDEVERSNGLGHAAVVVFHIHLLGLEHASLDALFREVLDERLVLRHTLEGAEQGEESLVEHFLAFLLLAGLQHLLTLCDLLLGIGQILSGQFALNVD